MEEGDEGAQLTFDVPRRSFTWYATKTGSRDPEYILLPGLGKVLARKSDLNTTVTARCNCCMKITAILVGAGSTENLKLNVEPRNCDGRQRVVPNRDQNSC